MTVVIIGELTRYSLWCCALKIFSDLALQPCSEPQSWFPVSRGRTSLFLDMNSWPKDKYQEEVRGEKQILSSALSYLPHFSWVHLLLWTNTFHTDLDFFSPQIGNCAHLPARGKSAELLRNGDPLQLFNCYYLFEHLEFVIKSLSNPDSSQIQYSVSFQLFLFPQQWKDW